MSDPLHPSDRCWVEYHVRMGMTPEQAALALATYRRMLVQIMGREPEVDISDVLASAEQKLVEARQFTNQRQVVAERCEECGGRKDERFGWSHLATCSKARRN